MFHELAAAPFKAPHPDFFFFFFFFFTRLHSSCRGSRQSRVRAGRRGHKKKKKKKAKGGGEKKKKALKKTELAKLYFKVGWHIRGTSGYSSAFLRDIYELAVQHPKRAFCLKPNRLRPNMQTCSKA